MSNAVQRKKLKEKLDYMSNVECAFIIYEIRLPGLKFQFPFTLFSFIER